MTNAIRLVRKGLKVLAMLALPTVAFGDGGDNQTVGTRSVEIVRVNFNAKGVAQSVDLAFGVTQQDKTNRLFVVYGTVSGGDDPTAWENCVELNRIPPETETLNVPMPEGWETAHYALRYYLVPADLPYDDAVEYLESTGKEYVDTGCTHTAVTRIECLFNTLSPAVGDYNAPFGSRGSGSLSYKGTLCVFTRYNKETKVLVERGDVHSGKEPESADFHTDTPYWMFVDGQTFSWAERDASTTNSLTYTKHSNTEGGFAPMMIFSLNETASAGGVTANTACNTKMRLWSFKMTDGGNVRSDLVPVMKNGVGCLYDRVSGVVLGNISGQGAFVCGKRTIDPKTATATAVWEEEPKRTIEIAGTNCVAGVAQSLDLAFSRGTDGRKDVLFVSYGPVAGGDGASGWAHSECLGYIDGSIDTYNYTLPAGWGKSVRALQFFFAAPPSADYDSRIEYLESTGREWINTGIKHKYFCYGLATFDVLSGPVGSYNTPFGSRMKNGAHGFYMFTRYGGADKPGYCFGKGESFGASGAYPHDVPLTVRLDQLADCVYTNRYPFLTMTAPRVSENPQDYAGVGPILLFTMNETDTTDAVEPNTACNTKMRLRSFLMTTDFGTTTVCDFIPVVKDGEGMLYDRVTKTLKRNGSGEGAFVCGPLCYDGEAIRSKSALFTAGTDAIGGTRFWYRAEVTFAGYGGSSSVGGVPAQVLLSEEAFEGFKYDQCAADGSDIRFFSPEGVMLPHEIDVWDPSGISRFWVRLPVLNATVGAKVVMCWGAAKRTPAALPASDVWSDYLAVYHFNETAGVAKDSGPHGYDAVPSGVAVDSVGTNEVGVGIARYIPGGCFDAGHAMTTLLGQQFTVSGWYRVMQHTQGESPLLFSKKKESYDDDKGWYLALQENTTSLSINGGKGQTASVMRTFPDLAADWRCVFGSFDGNVATLDVSDGMVLKHAGPLGVNAPQDCDSPLRFFYDKYGTFTGFVDELRIRIGHPDADTRLAEFAAMSRNLVSFGPVQPIERHGLMLLVR